MDVPPPQPRRRFLKMDNDSIMTISILIEWKNEEIFIKGLREYFRQSNEQGQSDEEFLKWIEGTIKN